MAFKVIDDGNSSDKLTEYEKEYLKKLKNSILCTTNPPLEPIFGNKTCKSLTFDRKKGNCLACHMIDDGELAGNNGPPLLAMKARFPDREVLFQQIWDPTESNPYSFMPPFGKHGALTRTEINKIMDYLYTL